MTGHVVVATGVYREARCLRGLVGVVPVVGGGDPVALRRRIEAVAEGAAGIASFGMAGALVDGLAIGDWVVGDRLTGTTDAHCDSAWRDALAAALPGARIGGIYADGRMIASVAEKLTLGERHGALAVDMESHVAAAVAHDRGLPFAIVRCISDDARHDMPPAISVAMRSDGEVDTAAILRSILRAPKQIGAVASTAIGFARAMRSLRGGAGRLGAFNDPAGHLGSPDRR